MCAASFPDLPRTNELPAPLEELSHPAKIADGEPPATPRLDRLEMMAGDELAEDFVRHSQKIDALIAIQGSLLHAPES